MHPLWNLFWGDRDVHWGYDLDFDPWPSQLCCMLPRDVRTNFLPTHANGWVSKGSFSERKAKGQKSLACFSNHLLK